MPNVDILLIEDDPEDRRLVVSVLDEVCPGRRVEEAHDGAAALDLLSSERLRLAPPRVLLLDLKLPKVSGLEVLAHLRSDPRLKQVPVVVLTSSREAPDLERAYALGANSYLCKPVEIDEFIAVIRAIGMYWLTLNEVAS